MSVCNQLTARGTPCRNKNCHVHNVGTCSICLNPVRKTRNSIDLRCNHRFHVKCIDEWKRKGATTCPVCRNEMDGYRVTIRIENIDTSQSNVFSVASSREILSFAEAMGLMPEFTETEIRFDFSSRPDLDSLFRDLGVRLADLDPAIFHTE